MSQAMRQFTANIGNRLHGDLPEPVTHQDPASLRENRNHTVVTPSSSMPRLRWIFRRISDPQRGTEEYASAQV